MSPSMHFTRAAGLAAALVLAVVVLAGCGAEQRATDRTLSKREYIARADELQGAVQETFASLNGRLPATRSQAVTHVAALDDLIAGYEQLTPPADWADEHTTMLAALAQMRHSLVIVSRASARNRTVIERQVGQYHQAQLRFERAVGDINASR